MIDKKLVDVDRETQASRLPMGGMMKNWLLIVVLLGLLAISSAFGYWVWAELGEVEMSIHGWIALTLGAVVTFLVGAGLMALVFISHRRGFDDRANRPDD